MQKLQVLKLVELMIKNIENDGVNYDTEIMTEASQDE